MKDVNYLMKHLSFQRSQFAHHYLTPDDLWFEGMWTLHSTPILSSSPNPNHKSPDKSPVPSSGHTVLRVLTHGNPLCFLIKAILFFTQNSISQTQFGVRVQKLNLASQIEKKVEFKNRISGQVQFVNLSVTMYYD